MVAAAILAREGFSLIGDKALLIAFFLLVSAPVLSHVTARAAFRSVCTAMLSALPKEAEEANGDRAAGDCADPRSPPAVRRSC